jgi:hypothetical protein
VQCKRYAPGSRVGSKDMQAFIGMMAVHHRADSGIFVTTSGYTAPAIELGTKHGLTLIDGPRLAELIDEVHRRYEDPSQRVRVGVVQVPGRGEFHRAFSSRSGGRMRPARCPSSWWRGCRR